MVTLANEQINLHANYNISTVFNNNTYFIKEKAAFNHKYYYSYISKGGNNNGVKLY